jgi:hypothetical protein
LRLLIIAPPIAPAAPPIAAPLAALLHPFFFAGALAVFPEEELLEPELLEAEEDLVRTGA